MKRITLDLAYDSIGSVFYALGIYTFASNADFAPGGVSGLAILFNYLTQLPIGISTLLLNIPILLFSFRKLSKKFFLRSAKTMLVNTFFLDVVFTRLPVYQGDRFLASLFTGVLVGIGCALIYSRGSSTGGIDFLIMAIRKKHPHISLGQIILVFNIGIILLGSFLYKDVNAILFGLVATYADTTILDKIMYGLGRGKVIMIITQNGNGYTLAQKIDEKTQRGSTLIKVLGTFSHEEKDMILCACSPSQFSAIRQVALELDPNALVMITESNEVYGNGFRGIASEN